MRRSRVIRTARLLLSLPSSPLLDSSEYSQPQLQLRFMVMSCGIQSSLSKTGAALAPTVEGLHPPSAPSACSSSPLGSTSPPTPSVRRMILSRLCRSTSTSAEGSCLLLLLEPGLAFRYVKPCVFAAVHDTDRSVCVVENSGFVGEVPRFLGRLYYLLGTHDGNPHDGVGTDTANVQTRG